MVEYLQNYFWHQCTPNSIYKALPHHLAALCRTDAMAKKAKRPALAKQLASDEHIILQLAESKGMCAVIYRKIVSFGIDVLSPGESRIFGHVHGMVCVDSDARNLAVGLQARLTREGEAEQVVAGGYERRKDGEGELGKRYSRDTYHIAKLQGERQGQRSELQKQIEASVRSLGKHMPAVFEEDL
jgi:hypothetical protein